LHTSAYAAVVIADEHAATFVDRRVEEIEQIAAWRIAANSAALYRIARSGVNCRPGVAAVVSGGYIEVPDTGKSILIEITVAGSRSKEGKRSALRVARHNCGEHGVLNPERRADVTIINPRLAIIF
jgi:hypothetical protein